MPKDIREILDKKVENKANLSMNHRERFQHKLQTELHLKPKEKQSFRWMYVAASIVLLVSLVIRFYPTENTIIEAPTPIVDLNEDTNTQISLGTISPELKTIEAYYTNSINYELSQLELTDENKELFDGYLNKLKELTQEYKSLTKELNTKGVNDNTINALIGNLQLRLQLLKRMQKQLHEFKNPTQNEMQSV
ncbi:hypothetical protein WH52_09785 [Tenacibaculum holothuriorum]|uniref:Uncharacterized protein n=1 Tax=Tenacibaculum holothuriorum TaxID=1635173 RepID=A0A1Y2PCG9_9FLAO|nr:hypothetical protein [Tenacibaculum holothuriorum]OSY87711.1 hypothetical protein WH52_09785 [Tenacibaculum holothuriorum]